MRACVLVFCLCFMLFFIPASLIYFLQGLRPPFLKMVLLSNVSGDDDSYADRTH